MLKSVPYLAALLFSASLISLSAHADTQTPAALAAALADPRRPAQQVSLDAARKPAQLIAFARLKRGDKVADFMPGNAYFTRIMSDVVGNTGHVYAFLPADAFMGPADVAALNKRFFAALKPGGIYLVIDHVAEAGSGLRDTESLHRIDPKRLRQEIEAAGFVFDAQSNVLRNRSDDHKSSVFDGRVRGRTDQVVYRFLKPG